MRGAKSFTINHRVEDGAKVYVGPYCKDGGRWRRQTPWERLRYAYSGPFVAMEIDWGRAFRPGGDRTGGQ